MNVITTTLTQYTMSGLWRFCRSPCSACSPRTGIKFNRPHYTRVELTIPAYKYRWVVVRANEGAYCGIDRPLIFGIAQAVGRCS